MECCMKVVGGKTVCGRVMSATEGRRQAGNGT